MVAVVPPSGTATAGTVVVDEKVKVARFNVWAERFQAPVVFTKSRPGPVMIAVPVPESSRPVGPAKSTFKTLRSNEYVSPPKTNVHSGLSGVLADGGDQVNGVMVTGAPLVPT